MYIEDLKIGSQINQINQIISLKLSKIILFNLCNL